MNIPNDLVQRQIDPGYLITLFTERDYFCALLGVASFAMNPSIVLSKFGEKLEELPIGKILERLKEEKIFRFLEIKEVMKKSEEDQVKFLQCELPIRGDRAFPCFLGILRELDQGKLADEMERGIILYSLRYP